MYIEERKNKDGNVISYRLICSGKDPISGQHKNYTKTWKIPIGMTGKKEITRALNKAKFEFEEEVEKLSNGTNICENNIKFVDFANEWLESILARKEHSYNYYNSCKNHLKVILPYFNNYLLKNIGPNLIQRFYDLICASTYEKQVVVVKQSINDILKQQNSTKNEIAENVGINRLTLRLASKIGQQIDFSTAKTLCEYFKLPLTKYFDIKTSTQRYSKATLNGIKTTLVMILQEAKRRRLIEHNFGTKEYTKFKTEDIKPKEIYSEEEARQFINLALKENDLRKKAILILLIGIGLRKGEVAGLSWNDIDFQKNILSVNHNAIYVTGFGIKIKTPKTKRSTRKISMPKMVSDTLAEYKQWWETQKILHGNLWNSTQHLFIQDNGNVINPCTINTWVTKFENKHGLKKVPCHSLRHQCTCIMINAGVPLKVVSQILGHASIAFTLEVYNHIMQGQEEKAIEIYNNYLNTILDV